jgi:hypothetical protein
MVDGHALLDNIHENIGCHIYLNAAIPAGADPEPATHHHEKIFSRAYFHNR